MTPAPRCVKSSSMHIFGSSKAAPTGGAGGGAGIIPYVTERDFEQLVLLAETPALVQFTAERSQACKAIAPEVEAFAAEVQGKIAVFRADAEKSPALAQQLRIQQLPTFMLFVDQRLGDVMVGPITKKQLRAMTEPFMPRTEGLLKAKELAELIKQGVVTAVDVRDASAYGRAHLPGAKSLPAEEIEERLAELFMLPGQAALYDRAGEKAQELARKLTEGGNPVAFLEGGILAWESEGFKVERS